MIKKSEKFIILHFIIFSTFKMFIILHFIIFSTKPEIFIIFILSYVKYDNIVFELDFVKKLVPNWWPAQFISKYTDLVSHKKQCFGCSVRLGCSLFRKLWPNSWQRIAPLNLKRKNPTRLTESASIYTVVWRRWCLILHAFIISI